jgi:Cytochrome oxidase complex assembly protein 1
MEPTPLPPPMPRPNWFGRNWKWVVPVGCLLPVLFVGGCGLVVFWFATGIMKQSEAYKIALARAQANPAVIEAIGSPISQTGIVSGNSNVSGAVGEANLSIPLSGPKGKATLYVEAKKSADTWFFQTMVVKIEKTGERIDLNTLPVPARAASPPHL